ncbi:hypothetical protein CYMTET_56544, partial [Cymbomonas tetramitiformis]
LDSKLAEERLSDLSMELQRSAVERARILAEGRERAAQVHVYDAESAALKEQVVDLERSLNELRNPRAFASSMCGICGNCLKKGALPGRTNLSRTSTSMTGAGGDVAVSALGGSGARAAHAASVEASHLVFPEIAPSIVPPVNAIPIPFAPTPPPPTTLDFLSHIRIGALFEATQMKRQGYRVISVMDFDDEKSKNEEHSRWLCNKLVQKAGCIKRILRKHAENQVFIHCMQGVNRSVAAVCTFLLLNTPLSLPDVYRAVKSIRPQANVGEHNTFHYELQKIYEQEHKRVEDQLEEGQCVDKGREFVKSRSPSEGSYAVHDEDVTNPVNKKEEVPMPPATAREQTRCPMRVSSAQDPSHRRVHCGSKEEGSASDIGSDGGMLT